MRLNNHCLISLFRTVSQAYSEQQGEHRYLSELANRDISENEAADFGQLIETTISVPYYNKGQLLQVSGSAGFCFYPKHTNIRTSIMRHSSKDMFRRKTELPEQSKLKVTR